MSPSPLLRRSRREQIEALRITDSAPSKDAVTYDHAYNHAIADVLALLAEPVGGASPPSQERLTRYRHRAGEPSSFLHADAGGGLWTHHGSPPYGDYGWVLGSDAARLEAALAELQAVGGASPAPGWQPIETAIPATGQPVALWGPLWRQPFVGIVLPEAMGTNCYLDGKDGQGMHMRATHWMFLPDPPAGVSPPPETGR